MQRKQNIYDQKRKKCNLYKYSFLCKRYFCNIFILLICFYTLSYKLLIFISLCKYMRSIGYLRYYCSIYLLDALEISLTTYLSNITTYLKLKSHVFVSMIHICYESFNFKILLQFSNLFYTYIHICIYIYIYICIYTFLYKSLRLPLVVKAIKKIFYRIT